MGVDNIVDKLARPESVRLACGEVDMRWAEFHERPTACAGVGRAVVAEFLVARC
jgi:hypothetical protein